MRKSTSLLIVLALMLLGAGVVACNRAGEEATTAANVPAPGTRAS